MRHFLIIVFMLAGLTGQCFATGEQPADGGDSSTTTQTAEPAPEGDADKKQPKADGKKKPAAGEAEPECE